MLSQMMKIGWEMANGWQLFQALYVGGYFRALKVVLEAKMIFWAYLFVV